MIIAVPIKTAPTETSNDADTDISIDLATEIDDKPLETVDNNDKLDDLLDELDVETIAMIEQMSLTDFDNLFNDIDKRVEAYSGSSIHNIVNIDDMSDEEFQKLLDIISE